MRFPRPRSLAGQLFAMQVVLVTVLVAGCAAFTYVNDRAQAEESARHRVTATARTIAASSSVHEAIRGPDPSRKLQPYAERVREDTGVTFITIMNPRRVRWTHPNPERIGGTFVGHTAPALRGQTFSETYTGTLGPSVRVVTPIQDDGRTVGLVSAGIAVDTISAQVREQVTALLLVAGIALALGGVGTYVVNARLRRHTHGMNASELRRMHDYHQATLHAVREGLLMLDGQRRVALINDGAQDLLGVRGRAVVGHGVAELDLPAPLTGALLAAEPRVDEVHLTTKRVVVVNTSPVLGGERRGTVVTLRDHTELQSLAGELDSVRGFAESLRAQAHESANRLHTVVSLIELGRHEEAVEFATEELRLAQALTDQVTAAVAEPVLAALLLGKAAQAHERGVELVLNPDSSVDDGVLPPELPPGDLVTLLGNLLDNAVDAAAQNPGAGSPRVTVTVRTEAPESAATDRTPGDGRTAGGLLLRVADTGRGVSPELVEEVFRRGWSTKTVPDRETWGGTDSAGLVPAGSGLGLALVRQTAHRHGGTVTLTDSGATADHGAEFIVRLPLPAAGATGARATTGGPPRSERVAGGPPSDEPSPLPRQGGRPAPERTEAGV